MHTGMATGSEAHTKCGTGPFQTEPSQPVKHHHRRQQILFVAQVAGLFALFYSYVLLRVRPELFYHLNPLVFLFDSDFFAGFLKRPGGLVDYASAFLSQLFVWNWVGALVLTLLTLLICLATRQFLAASGGSGGGIVFLIPAVLILMVLGQYSDLHRLCVGLLVALVFTVAHIQLGRRAPAIRLTAFVIASALVYYAAAGAYVVYACLCAIYEFGVKRHHGLGALGVLGTLLIPLSAGVWLCDLSVEGAYRGLMDPFAKHWLAGPSSVPVARSIRAALLLFFPIAAITVVWRRRGAAPSMPDPANQPPRNAVAGVGHGSDRPGSAFHVIVRPVALVACVVAADLVLFDLPKKCLLEMDYSAERRRWADVLKSVRGIPLSHSHALDFRTVCQINRALYFKGGLLDQMFAYPQSMNTPALALIRKRAETTAQTTPQQTSDILFDLGRINESEHMAYEALEMFGPRPAILKRLVYIHVLKGEPEAAQKFLALLERSLLDRRWASECRRQLDADPLLSGVPMVASRRELQVVHDSINEVEHLESMLQQLLARNRHNRMAFEYLMAHYLLTGQLNKLAANLHRLDDFDYPRLPRYVEEALVIHLEATRSPEPDLGKRKIHPETRRRANEFLRLLGLYQETTATAFAALYRDFGDSYFFCYVFGNNCRPPKPSGPPK